ncbi:NDP-sugar synthase [Vaginella massiliensis]|uniref:nucleotidyltransferase family protein n=1 Tax=Vaginella massiliensis TaxID=1816680 RepID=UPI000838B87E|nr:nucleotidyltransferase family protein [Vaginella massiliensis]
MKAMLFAAGLGTRLQPFTLKHPKALALVNQKTLLQRNIEYLKNAGVTEIIINTHHFADQIEDFLDKNKNFGINIQLVYEPEVLETGGGLLNVRQYFDDDFLVMNVDILTDFPLSKLIAFHQTHHPLVSLAVSERQSSRKLLFTNDMRLQGWRNLKTEEEIIANTELRLYEYAFSGIHVINPKLFDLMEKEGKFSIMQVYMQLMKNEQILGYNHSDYQLIDVGRPESVLEAEKYFK